VRLPRRRDDAAGEGQQQQGRGSDPQLVPTHELLRAVAERVRARDDRPAFQVATDVLRELLDRRVAPLRILSERHQDDVVQVAREPATQLRRRLAPLPRDGLRRVAGCPDALFPRCRARDGGARLDRLLLADDARDLVRAERGQLVRAVPGQQLVENHAEAVDVAGGGDRLAPHLFGTRVAGCHHLRARDRRVDGVQRQPGVEDLRDAEVEQLRRAVRRDQDVARLQVPVHHKVLVGVLDSGAHAAEQPEAVDGRERVAVAVLVDPQALDVVEREPGHAIGGRPAVEETRDVRMIEAREDLPLVSEPVQDRLAVAPLLHQFDGRALAHFLARANRQVHGAHPTAPDLAHDPVRPDARARQRGGAGLRDGAGQPDA
jgi:hypothetical protein